MHSLKIDIDYPVTQEERDRDPRKPTNSQMTQDYIIYAVQSGNPQGLNGYQRKIFVKIQEKLSVSIADNKPIIELDGAEVELLRKSFESAKFPASFSKFVVLLEDHLTKSYEDKK